MSGCGKSTILRYISGLQKPTGGEVLIHGKPITDDNRVAMVFQQYSSLPWMTVLDNVSLALKYKGVKEKERIDRAMEMIELVGLKGHENKNMLTSYAVRWSITKSRYSQKFDCQP
ncbi:MAG: ATP-binding cassette domain-containing protein [Saprospiraceae bacterium]